MHDNDSMQSNRLSHNISCLKHLINRGKKMIDEIIKYALNYIIVCFNLFLYVLKTKSTLFRIIISA